MKELPFCFYQWGTTEAMTVLGKQKTQNRAAQLIHISTDFRNLVLQVTLQLQTAW